MDFSGNGFMINASIGNRKHIGQFLLFIDVSLVSLFVHMPRE